MSDRSALFMFLRDSGDPAADDALLEALASSDEQTTGWAVEALLARGTHRGLRGLVERIHLINEPHVKRLLDVSDRLFTVLREATQTRYEQTWLNVLELIRKGELYRASYLLESALHQRSVKVREYACQTLVALTDRLLSRASADVPPEDGESQRDDATLVARIESRLEDRHQLAASLESALAVFEAHRQEDVVRTSMWLADDMGARFWSLLSSPGGRLGRVAIKILGEPLSPRMVPFAMLALGRNVFRQQVADALSSARDPEFIKAWFGQSWRFAQAKVARGMAWVRTPACLTREVFEGTTLDPASQRLFGRWLTATGVAAEAKLRLLHDVCRQGAVAARASALGALLQWEEPGATFLLKRIATDGPEDVRNSARLELARRLPNEYPLDRLVASLLPEGAATGQRTPEVLETHGAQVARFEDYWTIFDSLDRSQRQELGREVLAASSDTALQLRQHLLNSDAVGKVRALCMTRTLDLAGALEEDICRLFKDASPEVRSAVVSALGKVASPASRRILYDALSDDDSRVRANAVEAIDWMGDRSPTGRLLPLLASSNNRERANAVRALLKLGVREAAETLLRMLADEDRTHRVSALWLVENLGLMPLATRVARMAASDIDAQVRARAERLAGRLYPEPADEVPTHEPLPQAAEVVRS